MIVAGITAEVRALERLDLQALRAEWRRQGFGAPPKMRSPDLLRRILAWKLQARALGGLDGETLRLLRRASTTPEAMLDVGARIGREWQGVRHEVAVIERGYRYAGEAFDSLSQVARKITGSRWNGPRFFGLREAA